MTIRIRVVCAAVILVATMLAGNSCRAQAMTLDEIKTQADMDKTSAALDAELFDAYNKCDLVKFKSLLADDVEFFHDKGGVTLGAQALTDSVKKNICGRVSRELVAGTLQSHRMDGYGILQQGVHRFHHPGHDDTEAVGAGQFITLWQYKDGAWKITRAISFDHRTATK
jgi:hypothetical protein